MSRGFNSILVRLKVIDTPVQFNIRITFQFHTGSIKSLDGDANRSLVKCFNSILVRLKGEQMRILLTGNKFQFHTGSIKSVFSLGSKVYRQCFNSILVRLKGAISDSRATGRNLVSIPYWFD